MNADLPERFRGGRRLKTQAELNTASDNGLDLTLNLDIRDYVEKQGTIKATSAKDVWLSQPEVPGSDELAVGEASLAPNKIDAPYRNKDKYLKTHYALLREDALGSLREAIEDFRLNPGTREAHKFSVYDQVRARDCKEGDF